MSATHSYSAGDESRPQIRQPVGLKVGVEILALQDSPLMYSNTEMVIYIRKHMFRDKLLWYIVIFYCEKIWLPREVSDLMHSAYRCEVDLGK
jgi:hypothetical protein